MLHLTMGRALRAQFPYAPHYRPLNHGSFGSCPNSVLAAQRAWRDRVEEAPDYALRLTYPAELRRVRAAVANLVGCDHQDLVLVPNATTGTNTVLRSLQFGPGDALLTFSTSYSALHKTVLFVCQRTGAQHIEVELGHPTTAAAILERTEDALRAAQGRIKLAVIDTISSVPAIRLPFEELTALCRRYRCLSLIDGAHGVGCIPLDLRAWQPDFFTSNLHKWHHCPRPNALLYVAREHQMRIHSLPISHGYPAPGVPNPLPPATIDSAFVEEFAFVGTTDISGVLAIPAAFAFRAALGGEAAIYAYLSKLSQTGGAEVARLLGTEVLQGPCAEGAPMVNVRLPWQGRPADPLRARAAFEHTLRHRHDTFVPMFPHAGAWWARLSAQVYLEGEDLAYAATALQDGCRAAQAA